MSVELKTVLKENTANDFYKETHSREKNFDENSDGKSYTEASENFKI